MTYNNKIGKEEQDQRTYENDLEARRVTTVGTSYDILIKTKTTDINIFYIGKALIGSNTSNAVWQIKIVDKTLGTEITFKNNVSTFTQIWNNREI